MHLDELHTTTLKKRNRRNKFKSYLQNAGKSMTRLAKELGRHKSTVSRLASGSRNPSIDTLSALADTGMDVVDIFGIGKARPDAEELPLQ